MNRYRGINRLQSSGEEIRPTSSNNIRFINKLEDGGVLLFRFLLDYNELFIPDMHMFLALGSNGGKFEKRVVCMKKLEGEPCEYCTSTDEAQRSLRPLIHAWIWPYKILHLKQNPNAGGNNPWKDNSVWKPTIYEGKHYFQEVLEKPCLLTMKFGQGSYMRKSLLGYINKYGTLTDRQYDLKRTGSGTDTTYALMPNDREAAESNVLQAADDLPDIIDVVCERIVAMPGQEKVGAKTFGQLPDESKADEELLSEIEGLIGTSDADDENFTL